MGQDTGQRRVGEGRTGDSQSGDRRQTGAEPRERKDYSNRFEIKKARKKERKRRKRKKTKEMKDKQSILKVKETNERKNKATLQKSDSSHMKLKINGVRNKNESKSEEGSKQQVYNRGGNK